MAHNSLNGANGRCEEMMQLMTATGSVIKKKGGCSNQPQTAISLACPFINVTLNRSSQDGGGRGCWETLEGGGARRGTRYPSHWVCRLAACALWLPGLMGLLICGHGGSHWKGEERCTAEIAYRLAHTALAIAWSPLHNHFQSLFTGSLHHRMGENKSAESCTVWSIFTFSFPHTHTRLLKTALWSCLSKHYLVFQIHPSSQC